jgi:CubicO group peptidase (beta-lactamase class C family)
MVFAVCVFLVCPGNVTAASPGHTYDALVKATQSGMKATKVPGLSIVIVNDRGVVWKRNFGVVRQDSEARVTAGTVYRVGEISMAVTAAAILRQNDTGRLQLDTPVQQVLPAFRPRNRFAKARPVTLRALLANYSGLPADVLRGMFTKPRAKLSGALPPLSDIWLTDAPETRYRRSGLGYMVLGCVVEAVTGRRFADAVHDDFLAPLGMRSSSFNTAVSGRNRIAAPHRNGQPVKMAVMRNTPANGLLTTADDLARFVQMLLNGGKIKDRLILKRQTAADMFQPQFTRARWPFARRTGLSWRLKSLQSGDDTAWLSGKFPGYASHIAMLPKEKLGVIVLANDEAAATFTDELAKMALKLARQSKNGGAPEDAPSKLDAPHEIKLAPAILDRYAGPYVVFNKLTQVVRDGNKLAVSVQGNDLDVVPVAKDRLVARARIILGLFSVPLDGYTIRMKKVAGRQIAVVEGTPEPLVFEKASGVDIPQAWRRRAGAWRVLNPDQDVHVKAVHLDVKGGVLMMSATVSIPTIGVDETTLTFGLRPTGNNVAVTMENGIGDGDTIEAVVRNGRETLTFSGFTLRQLAKKRR